MPATKPCILCVDDNEVGLKIQGLLLERQGYRVICATTGEKALAALDSEQIDLAIVDYYLGLTKGTDLAAMMKHRRRNLPILLISGAMEISDVSANVDAFFMKGEGPENLLALVRQLLHVEGEEPVAA